ncbi:PC11X-like protein [Mya arenaria]|uniref:PC11X-like protein n=1 Tax=Mya arenaria TaxID=6604 RepID=A0ABY7DSB7_MYAAR|nr:protocadherin alpha-12-like [Mya arenaria]WAQ97850.1 PC11X-like protein [Mya arenaria]
MAAAAAEFRRIYSNVIVVLMLCLYCRGQEVLQYSIYEQLPSGSFVGDVREDSHLRSTASAEEFSQIDYSLLSQGKVYEQYFHVDGLNGSLFTNTVIDRETITECVYETECVLPISIVAKSKISAFFRTLKVTVSIVDINDHSPKFPVEFKSLTVSEVATVGSSMALDGATDADSGNNTLQRYFILNEDALDLPFTTTYETYFDGRSVVKLQIKGDLDRESRDSYSLVIVAEDGGSPHLTGSMTVTITIDDVNDNPPVFGESEYKATINETLDVGEEIIRLLATDADIGVNSLIEYRLSKNQIGKIHEQFNLDITSGSLTLKERFASGGEYRIIVEASDRGSQPLMSQAVIIITVLDSDNNRPQIKINLFTDSDMGTVSEFADVGTVVAHVGITDEDTGANGIISCEMNSDNQVFNLQSYDDNEYKVTVAKQIDRETMDYIYVIINCHDKGTPPQNTFVEFTVQVLDENDHSPVFLQEIYFVDIMENNIKDTDIVQVSAKDIDLNQNGEVTYSLWASGEYRFTMDPQSGVIKTQSVFDREKNASIMFYTYAIDQGKPARTSTATVQINVLDQNDNDPVFGKPMYELYVSENAFTGLKVGNVTVSDADAGNNGRVGLHIDPALPFHMSTSGDLTLKNRLNREATATYSFLVTAYDHGIPARNTSANVVIHVTDVNDNPPRFVFPDSENYTIEVDSESAPRSVIAKIKAFDLDQGVNSELFYSIENHNVTELFAIDAETGDLILTRVLHATDRQIYNILLRVEDKGNPSLYATTSMNVFIVRKVRPSPVTDTKGENLLIAITLGSVTFVLVFTIVLVLCILKRRWNNKRNESGSEDEFCGSAKPGRRVKFADTVDDKSPSPVRDHGHPPLNSMTTFSCDGNESRDSDMTSSTVDLETPILEKQMNISKDSASPSRRCDVLPGISERREIHHSTPRSGDNQSRFENQPRSDYQLQTLQSHNSLLNSTVKPGSSVFAHDDNQSQTSGETATSDSGRGGSESDIHSASLSQSHDSDVKPTAEMRYLDGPKHSTFIDPPKPWLNLADLQYHNCNKLPVVQQLHDDRKHRLQLRNLGDRRSSRPAYTPSEHLKTAPRTQSDRNFDRNRLPGIAKQVHLFPPPPSDIDRSFMTYEEEEDDLSTTTSGSYTIDHDDISLDFRSPISKNGSGLRGCLV